MTRIECERAKRLIQLELDGELRDDDARLLDAHLQQCEACRRYHEELIEIEDALRQGLETVDLPEPGVAETRRRVRRTDVIRSLLYTWLPAAAAFLVVTVGIVVGRGMPDRPEPLAAPAIVVSGGDAIHVFEPDRKTAHPGRTGAELKERSVAWGLGGDLIGLKFASGARVELSDEAVVRIGRTSVDLFKGDLRADLTDADDTFSVVTPWGEFSGAGSAFAVHSDGNGTGARLAVISGEVTVTRRGSTRTLSSGQAVTLAPDPDRTIVL